MSRGSDAVEDRVSVSYQDFAGGGGADTARMTFEQRRTRDGLEDCNLPGDSGLCVAECLGGRGEGTVTTYFQYDL